MNKILKPIRVKGYFQVGEEAKMVSESSEKGRAWIDITPHYRKLESIVSDIKSLILELDQKDE